MQEKTYEVLSKRNRLDHDGSCLRVMFREHAGFADVDASPSGETFTDGTIKSPNANTRLRHDFGSHALIRFHAQPARLLQRWLGIHLR